MARMYGDGKPLQLPSFILGFETPEAKRKRLRETNDALKKNEERRKEAENRRLFANLERQDKRDLKLTPASPASPPKPEGIPNRFPEAPPFEPGKPWNYKLISTGPPVGPRRYEWVETDASPTSTIGSQARLNEVVSGYFDEYEETYGKSPVPGSPAYTNAHARGLEFWTNEQGHVPNDIVAQRTADLTPQEETILPPTDVDSKYDIHIDTMKADLDAVYLNSGVLQETMSLEDAEVHAQQIAGGAVNTYIKSLEVAVREQLGPNATDED
ncbi:hypothetical protein LCGC14_2845680, partial [marine sediment metagenome]